MKKTAKSTLLGSIMFEGAADGDIYFVRQDGSIYYVQSNMGIDTRGVSDFKNIQDAIKYALDSIKNSYQ